MEVSEAYDVRRLEVETLREMREEMRRRNREERIAEVNRLALCRQEHGRRCLANLILFVRACSAVYLAERSAEVVAQDVDESVCNTSRGWQRNVSKIFSI